MLFHSTAVSGVAARLAEGRLTARLDTPCHMGLLSSPVPHFAFLQLKLSRMLVDGRNGQIYVGAVNSLFQLSTALEVERFVETGPRLDSPMCATRSDKFMVHTTSGESHDQADHVKK
jgi:hypothetical protein